MPLIAFGWTTEEEKNLVQLVQPHPFLYNVQDPSRKNIIARESTWKKIGNALSKPVEECKKRWRGLRDSYMRSKRLGQLHPSKVAMFESLQFLDESNEERSPSPPAETEEIISCEEVITDNPTFYEITLPTINTAPSPSPSLIKIEKPDQGILQEVVQKKRAGGRKKAVPVIRNAPPVKILPKPMMITSTTVNNGPSLPKIVKYIEEPQAKIINPPERKDRSQMIDKLIERVLRENTNEIDVFFRSMSASVKKLHPSLIPKVKMEVCNVIAKYEMQNFDKE